jgi:hypothetical protein
LALAATELTSAPSRFLSAATARYERSPHDSQEQAMDFNDAQGTIVRLFNDANAQFHKMPGSAIILRYIKSSYQNDPVRSAIELFLFLFAVRYLLAPTYSTQKNKQVQLSEEVCTCKDYWGAIVAKGLVGNRRACRRMDAGTARCAADTF